MQWCLKLPAYLFHPLCIPTYGALLFFIADGWKTTQFQVTFLQVVVLTFLTPIVIFFLLQSLRLIQSAALHTVKERKYPLIIQCVLFLLVLKFVVSQVETPVLFGFFSALFFTSLVALLFVLLRFKVSLHQIGVANLFGFSILLITRNPQVFVLIMVGFIVVNGWMASSRLFTKSHTPIELFIGFCLGFLVQILLPQYIG